MGFSDDLQMRLSQSLANATNSVDDYLFGAATDADPQVMVADQAPGGNVTALDIYNGIFGRPPSPAKPKAPASATQNASPRPPPAPSKMPYWLLPLVAVGAVYMYTRGKA